MAQRRTIILTAALGACIAASVMCWRLWLDGAGDPNLTQDPRAFARATGVLMTPAGFAPAAAFSDGPGRIAVADALALAGRGGAEAQERLGKPDLVLGEGKAQRIALWWNAVRPEAPDATQPPAFHLRLDLDADRVVRVACIGARLAEIHHAPR